MPEFRFLQANKLFRIDSVYQPSHHFTSICQLRSSLILIWPLGALCQTRGTLRMALLQQEFIRCFHPHAGAKNECALLSSRAWYKSCSIFCNCFGEWRGLPKMHLHLDSPIQSIFCFCYRILSFLFVGCILWCNLPVVSSQGCVCSWCPDFGETVLVLPEEACVSCLPGGLAWNRKRAISTGPSPQT